MQLIDFFDRGASFGLHAPCLVEPEGRSLSYAEVSTLSHRVANGLHAAGVTCTSQVGLLSANHLMTFVAVLGIVRSEGVWLPVNARNSAEENTNILARGGCEFLFIHSSFANQLDMLRRAMPDLKGIVSIDGGVPGVPALEDWAGAFDPVAPRVDAQPDDVVAIRGTGGTTGLPKGVMVTHRIYGALMANWFAAMPIAERPVHLVATPLSHAAGAVAFATMAYGGVNIILPAAEPGAVLRAIGRYRVTQLFLPPTVIYKLLSHPDVRSSDTSSLRYLVYSAAPMSVDKLREALDIFGPVMVQCFGQAEAPFVATCMTAGDHAEIIKQPALAHRLASCGRASPFIRVGVMDREGRLLGAGERGEVVIQGDLVMKGYYRDPDKTSEALKHGWLHTGDVGYMDADGYYYIVDRIKDLIVSGGFNISPGEIEQVLWAHPAVSDCAVIGVPDDLWGEAVKAVIELKTGAHWNADEALDFCRARLGGMKTPKSIEVWDQLPRSNVGKVLKREIRERFWTGRERQV
jgi:acyl-CoA synthetase (AMP-forming)/AMP-acid ligase II